MNAPYADAAPTYRSRGWSPLPLPPRRKAPPPSGWTGYEAPMASGADVAEWAANGLGSGNIGLRLPETVIGLDVDAYADKLGLATMLDAIDRLGRLPKTVKSTSRGDGVSGIRFYRVPGGRRWADVLGPGVEVIHWGHRYALAWPSLHPEGREYAWYDADGKLLVDPPSVEDLPELPAAWVEELDRSVDRTSEPPPAPGPSYDDLPGETTAAVDAWTTAAVASIQAELRASAAWSEGQTDDRGRGWEKLQADAANRLGRLARAGWCPLSVQQAQAAFLQAAPTSATWTGADVTSKWRAQHGRGDPAIFPAGLHRRAPVGNDLDDDLQEGMHHGQLRMAYRLAGSPHRDKLLHVHGVGWHRWDGRRWAYDDQGHAVRAVRRVLRQALEDSLGMESSDAKAIRRDVDRCSSATGTAGVLALAATMAPFAATVQHLDADPYLLNCANGTLDLRTLSLRQHDPADRITKVTAAAYDPRADQGEWVTFLDRVLPKPEVRGFLQRLAGLALLGRVAEHVLGILIGAGANGKGVFTRALEHALGDYASTAEAELFMQREGAHPTGEMDLLGRRWVTVSETDQGRRLAEATVKRLTGGDTIKARKMRQDFVEFVPSHTAVLVTNHLPAVRGDDPAIWRRIRVVPFDVVIPEAERDKHLDERLQLQAEAVLAWAVAGYRDYAAYDDLREPEAVKVATSAYRLDSDPVARFLADECSPLPHGYVAIGELYARWQHWAAEDGAPEMTVKALGQALERKGYPADKQRHVRIRRGLVLIDRRSDTDGA